MSNWVPVDTALRNHPKLARFARRLDVNRAQAIGHLVLLWTWALDYAPDGQLGTYESEELADAAMYDGDPGAFLSAITSSGFADAGTDRLTLHDWEQYGGKLGMYRRANRERQARHRERQLANDDVTVTSQQSNGREESRVDKSRDSADQNTETTATEKMAPRKRRDPIPTPSSVEVFRTSTGRYPPKPCYSEIAEAVTDSDGQLKLWETCCREWVRRGYNPQNVSGMLEWFRAGGPPQLGHKREVATTPAVYKNPDGTFFMPVGGHDARR